MSKRGLFFVALAIIASLGSIFPAFQTPAYAIPQPPAEVDCSKYAGYCFHIADPESTIKFVKRPITEREYHQFFVLPGMEDREFEIGDEWLFLEVNSPQVGVFEYIAEPAALGTSAANDSVFLWPVSIGNEFGVFYVPSVADLNHLYWCSDNQRVNDTATCQIDVPLTSGGPIALEFIGKWIEESESYEKVTEDRTPRPTICVDGFRIVDGSDTKETLAEICKDHRGILIPGSNLVSSVVECEVLKRDNPGLENVQTIDCLQTKEAIQNASSDESHEKQCSGIAIGWILCGMVEAFFDIIRFLFEHIFQPLLFINPLEDNASPDSPAAKLFDIWNSVRILASIGFVIVFVLSIVTNSFGFILSAYDFKKTLPRLAIGIVGIQLSWYVIAFAIDVFNILGAGVQGLILAPVTDLTPSFRFDLSVAQETLVAILLTKGAVTTFTLAGSLKGMVGLLPMILLPIVLFLVTAILVLIFRQILIILLVVTAPLAALAWALPNTEKLAKMWGDTLVKILMMFPLIMAFIASGELLASLVTQNSNSALLRIAGIVALFAPYFLIPLTFQMAGNVVGGLTQGFNRVRGGITQKVFGSVDDPGSYRGTQRGIRNKIRSQSMWERTAAYNKLHKGRPAGARTTVGNFRSSRDRSRATAWGRWARAQGQRTGTNLLHRTGGSFIGERLADRTREAKRKVDLLGHNGNRASIFALFGDTHPITGERLPNDAINAAIRYRDDDAMLTAGMIDILSQVGSEREQQAYINYLATTPQISDNFKPGIWKGAGFANQKIYRDFKHRSITAKKRGSDDYGLITDEKINDYLREAVEVMRSPDLMTHAESYWHGVNEVNDRLKSVLEAEAGGQALPENDKWSDKRTMSDGTTMLARDLINLSDLRAGMIDNLAAGKLGVGEEAEEASQMDALAGGGFVGRVTWRRNDVAKEIATTNLRQSGITAPTEQEIAAETQHVLSTQAQAVEDLHGQRIEEILGGAQRQGSMAAHAALVKTIRETAWVDDASELSRLDSPALRAQGIDPDRLMRGK